MKKPILALIAIALAIAAYFSLDRRLTPIVNTDPVVTPAVATTEPPAHIAAAMLPAAAPTRDIVAEIKAALKSPDPLASILPLVKSLLALSPKERAAQWARLGPMLTNLSPELSRAVHQAVHDADPTDGQMLGNALLLHLCKIDPAKAAAWVAGLDFNTPARQFHQTIGRQWAERDQSAAMAWINTLQENMHTQAAAVEGLADVWSTKNIDEFLGWANKIEDDYVRGAALLKGAKTLALTDAPAAAKLSLSFTDPISQGQGIRAAITAWVPTDATSARNFIDTIPASQVKTEAQLSYFDAMVRKDPASAKAYLSQLPENLRAQAESQLPPQ
jgi:hypothetical protein